MWMMRAYSHNANKAISPENAAHKEAFAQNNIPIIKGNKTKAVSIRCLSIRIRDAVERLVTAQKFDQNDVLVVDMTV